MAHFVELNENNIVERVIVISNEVCGEPELSFPATCEKGQLFISETLQLSGTWRQCSYNGRFRGSYPGPGWIYSATENRFIEPERNEESFQTAGEQDAELDA